MRTSCVAASTWSIALQRVALRDSDRIQLATELLVFRTSDRGVPTVTEPMPFRASQKDRAT